MTRFLDRIAALGIAAATVALCAPAVVRGVERARERACHQNLRLLTIGLRSYQEEWGGLPATQTRVVGADGRGRHVVWQEAMGLQGLRCPVRDPRDPATYGLNPDAPSARDPARAVLVTDGAVRIWGPDHERFAGWMVHSGHTANCGWLDGHVSLVTAGDLAAGSQWGRR